MCYHLQETKPSSSCFLAFGLFFHIHCYLSLLFSALEIPTECTVNGSIRSVSMTIAQAVQWESQLFRHAFHLNYCKSDHLMISWRWRSPPWLFICFRCIHCVQGFPNLGPDPYFHKVGFHSWPHEELLTFSTLYYILMFFLGLEWTEVIQYQARLLLMMSSVAHKLKSTHTVYYVAVSYGQLADWHYFWSSI